jgi:prefoldin subunit 5
MACKKCNNCQDNGCAPLVYPKCILLDKTYTCLSVAAGKTGADLFTAIDAAICTLQNSIDGVKEDIATINTNINEITNDITGIENNITDIENDVTDINVDIVEINSSLDTIINDIQALEDCVYDASGNCSEPESWKTVDASGFMQNGEAIPALTNGTQNAESFQPFQLRANKSYVDMRGTINITIDANSPAAIIATLPVGYRPIETQFLTAMCREMSSSNRYPVDIGVNAAGILLITVQGLTIPNSYALSVDFYISFDTL